MTIHSEHPFLEPPDDVRRFRGRLGGAVSLWTAGSGTARAGLTVSSVMVANGDPAAVVGLLDPDSDFYETFESSGTAVVHLLGHRDQDLAEAFGGQAPAPGGLFRLGDWTEGGYGPELARTLARVRFVSAEDVGWSRLVVTTIESVVLTDADDPLEHRRGRYRRSLGSGA